MPRFSVYALLLIVLAVPAAGGDPDQVDPSASEILDLRSQLERLLERAQKSRSSTERRELYVEALSLARELAIYDPGADSQRQLCEVSQRAKDVNVVVVCEEADRVAEASDAGSTRFLLAQAYVMAGRWQDAETALLETLELLDEGEARRKVYIFLGFVYEKTLRIDEAMAAYAKGGKPGELKRTTGGQGTFTESYGDSPSPRNLETWRVLLEHLLEWAQESRGLDRQRLYAEALPLAEKLAVFDPAAGSQRQLCEICLGARHVKAVAACEEAMRVAEASDAGWTRFLLANAYSLTERWQDAETVLLEAIELLDEVEMKRRFYRFLGFIYEKTKRYDEAIAAYAQGDDPTSVERVQQNLETSPFSADIEGPREKGQELKEELDARKPESGGGDS